MRTHMTRRTIPWALAAALLLAAGCGDDDNEASAGGNAGAPPPAEATAAGSAYCDVALEWAIHELTPFDDSDPAAMERYWADHTEFEERALATTPDELKADWELKMATEDETIDVVLEKYGYDVVAIMEQGTPEEQATFEAPPDVTAAQSRIGTYESETCGSAFPEPADVSYAGEEPGSYCELVGAEDERAREILAAGGDPAAVEEFFSSQTEAKAAIVAAAPEVIKDDVTAVSEWTLGPQAEVIEAHGWEIAAVMRDGSAQERYDLNYADEDIREQYARVLAYEEQVCGA